MLSARELALNALLRQEKGEFLNSVIDDIIKEQEGLSSEERGLFVRLCEGSVEHRIYLDHVINTYSKTKVNKMKPVIRNVLRMATYQILFLERIPDAAAINEAVKLAAAKKFVNLKGFVNGVLRTISREKEKILEEEYPNLPAQIKFSMPEWIMELWTEAYGQERADKMAEALSGEKPIHAWLNPAKGSEEEILARLAAEGIQASPNPHFAKEKVAAYYLSGLSNPAKSQCFADGLFYIQDTASLLDACVASECLTKLEENLEGQESDALQVLDVCAAPGGKTLFTALSHPNARITCRDLSEKKINLIIDNIRRLGPENVYPEVWDATKKHKGDEEKYDLIIADLPCSGLGVLGRKSDIKYRVQAEDLQELKTLQQEILKVISGYLKKGGYLLYSTCTVHPGENTENAKWLQETFGYQLLQEEQLFPEKEPYHDGFYFALLQKK